MKKYKCRNTKCNKNGWIETFGRHYCLKHWIQDYKYGMSHGLKLAVKFSNFNILILFKKQVNDSKCAIDNKAKENLK